MEMFAIGFAQVFNISSLCWIMAGVLLGIIFGCIPGLTGSIALALCLPLIYTLDIIQSMCLIMGIYIGGCSGGLISAILINVPGTPSNIATSFDGHPMAAKGEAGKALGTGIFYSFLGGTFSFIILFAIAGPLGRVAVQMGKGNLFALTFFALTLVSGLCGKSILKGLTMALIGMALSMIGISAVDGTPRLTMGLRELNAGLQIIPALIGLYAVSELIKSTAKAQKLQKVNTDFKIKGFGFTWQEFKEQLGNFFRSALIGTGIGILPGIGGMTSNLLAYMAAKNSSKTPEKYGTGYIGGIVAPETANNASVGGAMVPLLALGIPGDGFTAVVLGALMLQGLTPGPLFMIKSANVAYAIFAALIIANIFTIFVEYFFIRGFVRLLSVPKHVLMSVVIVLAMVGAFGINNRIFDAWTVLFFGVLGYLVTKLDFPLTPLILGLILGADCEEYLRIALQITKGSFFEMCKDPVTLVFLLLSVASIALAPRMVRRANKGPEGKELKEDD